MDATTTDKIREHFRPGDTVVNSRAERHTVFKVLHSGYGFSGVLLTTRAGSWNKHITYVTWTVSVDGIVRATMTTDDFPAASGAFEARVVKVIRAEFTTEGDQA